MSDSCNHWEDLDDRWSVLVRGPEPLTEREREIVLEYLEHVGGEEAHKVGMVAKERKDESHMTERKNAYWCKTCHGYIVTEDIDEGVTPMFLACRALGEPGPANPCKGQMVSMMYPAEPWPEHDGFGDPIPTVPTWEWYRPDERELKRYKRKRDMAALEHVRKGGLLLRKRP